MQTSDLTLPTHGSARGTGPWRQLLLAPAEATDPLAGLSALARQLLPALGPADRTAHAAELRTLVPGAIGLGGGPSLEDVALPSSERRLSRESERVFRLVNALAAMMGSVGPVCVVVPDLDRADRLALHLIHRLRSFAHPHVRLLAGTLPDDAPADAAGVLRRQAVRAALRDDTGLAPVLRVPPQPCAPELLASNLEQVSRLAEWGLYEEALRGLAAMPHWDSETHRIAALVHAYLGDIDRAQALYARAGELAETPVQRARCWMFQALLASKRRGHHEEARRLASQGHAALAGTHGDAAQVEHGWLTNVEALTRYAEGHCTEAVALCNAAIGSLKACRGSDALHLKINLVSNLSIVYESLGRPRDALAVWQHFRQFLQGPAAALFAKIYHYRAAGLLWRAGDAQAAAAAYRTAHDEAARVHDRFHLTYIAHDLGLLHLQRDDLAGAGHWFEQAMVHAGAVGDGPRHALAAQVCAWLAARRAGSSTPAPQVLDAPPGSKLGRPFHLLHLPAGGSPA